MGPTTGIIKITSSLTIRTYSPTTAVEEEGMSPTYMPTPIIVVLEEEETSGATASMMTFGTTTIAVVVAVWTVAGMTLLL